MISEVQDALKAIDDRVLYGVARADASNTWDCLLIRKERIEKSGTSKLGYSQYISVRIIREDAVPEGMEMQVIEYMKGIGWKQSSASIEYEYTLDANEVVVEICKIEFYKVMKGCVA